MKREENGRARDRQISIALRIMKQGRQFHTREWIDKKGRKRCYDDVYLSSFFNALNADIESITITSCLLLRSSISGVDTMVATVKTRDRRIDAKQVPFRFYSRTSGTWEERQSLDKTTADDLIIRISMRPNSDENSPSYYEPTFIRVIKDNKIIPFGGTRLDYEKIAREYELDEYRRNLRMTSYYEYWYGPAYLRDIFGIPDDAFDNSD